MTADLGKRKAKREESMQPKEKRTKGRRERSVGAKMVRRERGKRNYESGRYKR